MRIRAAILGVVLVATSATTAGAPVATARSRHHGSQITFEECEEVFAIATVPVANVRAHLPDWVEPAEMAGGVDVQLRTARCVATIDDRASDWLSSEVRISIKPPDGVQEDGIHLVGYQLSWATDDRAFASWVRNGTDLGDVMTLTKVLARTSNPDALGRDTAYAFDSPVPERWAFRFDADATWPADEAKTPIVVDVYRHTDEGLVRFRAESPLQGGDRIGGADVEVTVPADTALSQLLDGAESCVVDEPSGDTRCHATALLYGYAVEIEDQPFTKTIVPDHSPPSLEEARRATRPYADVSRALEAGYVPASECEEHPADGAMGIHFVNFELYDERLEPTRPEILLYVPTPDGLRLVGIEYLIDEAAVDGHPTMFGRSMDGPMEGHNNPLQARHYDLHVWLFEWAPNPTGMFAPYNLDLSCGPVSTEEGTHS